MKRGKRGKRGSPTPSAESSRARRRRRIWHEEEPESEERGAESEGSEGSESEGSESEDSESEEDSESDDSESEEDEDFRQEFRDTFNPSQQRERRERDERRVRGAATFYDTFMCEDADATELCFLPAETLLRYKDELAEIAEGAIRRRDVVQAYVDLFILRDFDFDLAQLGDLRSRITCHFHAVTLLVKALKHKNLLSDRDPDTQLNRANLLKIMRVFRNGYDTLESHLRRQHLRRFEVEEHLDEDLNYLECTIFDDEKKLNPSQRLAIFLLDELLKLRYRRYNGAVYHQVQVAKTVDADGNVGFMLRPDVTEDLTVTDVFDTHAWDHMYEMEEFVYRTVNRATHRPKWLDLTSSAAMGTNAASILRKSFEAEFPDLEPDRDSRGFLNGLLKTTPPHPTFYSYGSQIPRQIVCCKFYADVFLADNLKRSWYSIKTDALEKIFRTQKFGTVVKAVIYGLLGRMMYWVGEHDGWQVIPMLKGVGGSGKSTICKVIQQLFSPQDVGVLSSNVEPTFGIAALAKKLLFICFEVTRNFRLPTEEFQSMVSGESMSVAEKNKNPIKIDNWKVPGLLAGNIFFPLSGNGGSIDRRIVTIEFKYRATEVDPELDQKLKDEMPATIIKFQQAYMALINRYAGRGIWEAIPRYFQLMKDKLSLTTNAVRQVIYGTNNIVTGEGFNMTFVAFCSELKLYMQEHSIRVRYTRDEVRDILRQEGFSVRHHDGSYRGNQERSLFVFGMTAYDSLTPEEQAANPRVDTEVELEKQMRADSEEQEQFVEDEPLDIRMRHIAEHLDPNHREVVELLPASPPRRRRRPPAPAPAPPAAAPAPPAAAAAAPAPPPQRTHRAQQTQTSVVHMDAVPAHHVGFAPEDIM